MVCPFGKAVSVVVMGAKFTGPSDASILSSDAMILRTDRDFGPIDDLDAESVQAPTVGNRSESFGCRHDTVASRFGISPCGDPSGASGPESLVVKVVLVTVVKGPQFRRYRTRLGEVEWT